MHTTAEKFGQNHDGYKQRNAYNTLT